MIVENFLERRSFLYILEISKFLTLFGETYSLSINVVKILVE